MGHVHKSLIGLWLLHEHTSSAAAVENQAQWSLEKTGPDLSILLFLSGLVRELNVLD